MRYPPVVVQLFIVFYGILLLAAPIEQLNRSKNQINFKFTFDRSQTLNYFHFDPLGQEGRPRLLDVSCIAPSLARGSAPARYFESVSSRSRGCNGRSSSSPASLCAELAEGAKQDRGNARVITVPPACPERTARRP